MEEKKLTGYPSVDKPWLKFYQKDTILSEVPECTVYQNLYNHNKDHLIKLHEDALPVSPSGKLNTVAMKQNTENLIHVE